MRGALGRALLFAACAAAGVIPWRATFGPLVAGQHASALYALGLVAIAPAVVFGFARGGIASAVAASLAIAASAWTWMAPWGPGNVLLLSALMLAFVRGTFVLPTRPLVGLGREALLLAVAVLPGLWLFGPSRFDHALGTWWFWLIQSGATLWPEVSRATGEPQTKAHTDVEPARTESPSAAFERVLGEATELVERLEKRAVRARGPAPGT